MITKFGKRFLTNYLAGNTIFGNKEIALGIGSSSESDLSTRLDFEFARIPIEFGSIDIETNTGTDQILARDGQSYIDPGDTLYSVVYKTTLPQELSGIIKEIGLYPSSDTSYNTFGSKIIALFEDTTAWNLVGGTGNPELTQSLTPAIAKVGSTTAKITNNGLSDAIEYLASIPVTDFSGYSGLDSMVIAYIKADTNLSFIRIKLYSDTSSYYYLDFSSSSGTIEDGGTWSAIGNKIHSATLDTMFTQFSGNPDLTKINGIGIEVNCSSSSSPATVYFDALRINDEDTFNPNIGMISRSALTTEIEKISGQQLDLEYRLVLNF